MNHLIPPKRNPNIKYANPDLPEFNLPDVNGTRHQDTVPDTLDLAERATLAVHGLTATTDPDNNAELYWSVIFSSEQPFMYHDLNDWCEYKYYAPSVLLRQSSGCARDWTSNGTAWQTCCRCKERTACSTFRWRAGPGAKMTQLRGICTIPRPKNR